jgi:hypothetical protein
MSDYLRLVGRTVRGETQRRVRRQRSGRICADPSCATVLSTYNRSSYCWVHEPKHLQRTFGRQRLRTSSRV